MCIRDRLQEEAAGVEVGGGYFCQVHRDFPGHIGRYGNVKETAFFAFADPAFMFRKKIAGNGLFTGFAVRNGYGLSLIHILKKNKRIKCGGSAVVKRRYPVNGISRIPPFCRAVLLWRIQATPLDNISFQIHPRIC